MERISFSRPEISVSRFNYSIKLGLIFFQSVFASTCLGVNNPILAKHHFDYCIVDEASQITQPVCIGAVRLADVFVLIGDHNQLPPLVQSEKAR